MPELYSIRVTIEQLRPLVGYNRWANGRLLRAAAGLSREERERDVGASFGSVHGTLVHILWGERGWLHMWRHGAFLPDPVSGDYPDLESLRAAWADHEPAYQDYLLGLTQSDLDAPRSVDGNAYTLGELVQHTLTHSTHHRGQVVVLLRQLGHEPPCVDYRAFITEGRDASRHEGPQPRRREDPRS
jgi:uncharacterized damage-inducible protein DinB